MTKILDNQDIQVKIKLVQFLGIISLGVVPELSLISPSFIIFLFKNGVSDSSHVKSPSNPNKTILKSTKGQRLEVL